MFLLHPRFLVDVFSFVLQRIFISQTTDFHFANYKFSFRKLQISISQTTDFHFANYRFPFRFVPFRFVPFRFAPFRFANYSKPFLSWLPFWKQSFTIQFPEEEYELPKIFGVNKLINAISAKQDPFY